MNQHLIHVLLIEDNPGDARLIRERLADVRGTVFTMEWRDRLASGLACLEQCKVAGILLDLSLPDSQGLAPFSAIQAQVSSVPLLILTSLNDQALAAQAMQAGAQDYLAKRHVDEQTLVRAIRSAITRKQMEERLLQTEEQFRALIENGPDAIAILSTEGAIMYDSPATTWVLGYSLTEFVGRNTRGVWQRCMRNWATAHTVTIFPDTGCFVSVASRYESHFWPGMKARSAAHQRVMPTRAPRRLLSGARVLRSVLWPQNEEIVAITSQMQPATRIAEVRS